MKAPASPPPKMEIEDDVRKIRSYKPIYLHLAHLVAQLRSTEVIGCLSRNPYGIRLAESILFAVSNVQDQ